MRIGIIDDGIDMTRPSFSGAGYRYPPGFPKGLHASTNGKIIVARAFAPPGGSARMRTAFDPDGSEHGTHVAGIAAGLSGITGTSLGVTISGLSGVAPHAYLGSYRVLTTPTPSFGLDGNGPEIARAIDRAVSDGMDVLNLSLGEPEVESANDVVARAIHGAAKAGVVTVVAAGNSGDDLGSGSISSPGSAAGCDHGRGHERRALRRRHARRARARCRARRHHLLRRRDRRARRDSRRLEGRRAAGRRRSTARAVAPARSCSSSSARTAAPPAPTARSPPACSASSTPSAPPAIPPPSTTASSARSRCPTWSAPALPSRPQRRAAS